MYAIRRTPDIGQFWNCVDNENEKKIEKTCQSAIMLTAECMDLYVFIIYLYNNFIFYKKITEMIFMNYTSHVDVVWDCDTMMTFSFVRLSIGEHIFDLWYYERRHDSAHQFKNSKKVENNKIFLSQAPVSAIVIPSCEANESLSKTKSNPPSLSYLWNINELAFLPFFRFTSCLGLVHTIQYVKCRRLHGTINLEQSIVFRASSMTSLGMCNDCVKIETRNCIIRTAFAVNCNVAGWWVSLFMILSF